MLNERINEGENVESVSRRVMMVLERCLFDYPHFISRGRERKFLHIRFQIVRHSNEDNFGNGIALHHRDGGHKQTF